jgi:hypothetical protein
MRTIANIALDNPRGQCIVMLFAALHELCGNQSKRDTISFIQGRHWFDVQAEDKDPYPSATTKEPRWHTLIAWGRKDSVIAELMFGHPHDQWELTRRGIEEFRTIRKLYQTGELRVQNCFLWSPAFKLWMVPSYASSLRDWPRPKDLYRDVQKLSSRNIRLRILDAL